MRKSLFGGYPYEGIKSQEVFPNRIPTEIVDGKVVIEINPEIWDAFFDENKKMAPVSGNLDFLINRIHDYNNALAIAEKQIADMDEQYPFIPEDFNFKETEVVDDGLGTPMRFYEKGGFLLTRAKDHWLIRDLSLGSLMPENSFRAKLFLPNAQIAFITLRALGVISDEEFEGNTEYVVHQSEITQEELDAELVKRSKGGKNE